MGGVGCRPSYSQLNVEGCLLCLCSLVSAFEAHTTSLACLFVCTKLGNKVHSLGAGSARHYQALVGRLLEASASWQVGVKVVT